MSQEQVKWNGEGGSRKCRKRPPDKKGTEQNRVRTHQCSRDEKVRKILFAIKMGSKFLMSEILMRKESVLEKKSGKAGLQQDLRPGSKSMPKYFEEKEEERKKEGERKKERKKERRNR